MDALTATRPPAHLWVVGIISLLWNAFGGYDYVMSRLRDPAYFANFPPDMLPYLDSMPAWVTAFWAIGVWSSVAGSVLLLARSRHAVTAFAVSLAGLVISTAWQWANPMPASLTTPPMLVMQAVVYAGLLLFLWYAGRMKRGGVLR